MRAAPRLPRTSSARRTRRALRALSRRTLVPRFDALEDTDAAATLACVPARRVLDVWCGTCPTT